MRKAFFFGERAVGYAVASRRNPNIEMPSDTIPVPPDQEHGPPVETPPERPDGPENQPDPPPIGEPDSPEPTRLI
jgi:hypothetical protein